MAKSLWPDFTKQTPPRGMREMLYEAAGDVDAQTNGALQLHLDTLGVGPSGVIKEVRHTCYLKVAKTGYLHLLFRVTTPATGLWPATTATPEGETVTDIQDEAQLRAAIESILQRERTKEVVFYLLSTAR
jgi:hypothetical protein